MADQVFDPIAFLDKRIAGYEPERTAGGTLKDVGVSLGKGVVGAGEAVVGLADLATPGNLGQAVENVGIDLEGAQNYLSQQYSPAQQRAFEKVDEAKGFLSTLGAMVQNPSTIGHAIVESAPSMVAGGVVGRGLGMAARGLGVTSKAIPLVTGAAGEGAITAGQMQENVRRQSGGDTTLLQQAQALGAGLGTSAFGVIGAKLGGALAKRLGTEITDIDTLMAGGKLGSSKDVAKRIVAGGISEGAFEELPQSIQEQVWTNAALGQPLDQDVGAAGAAGLLAGAVMGGGTNVFARPEIDTTKIPGVDPADIQQTSVQEAIRKIQQNESAFEEAQANADYIKMEEINKNIAEQEDFIEQETIRMQQGLSLPNQIIVEQQQLVDLNKRFQEAKAEDKKSLRQELVDLNKTIESNKNEFVKSLNAAPESMFNLFLNTPELLTQMPQEIQDLITTEHQKYLESLPDEDPYWKRQEDIIRRQQERRDAPKTAEQLAREKRQEDIKQQDIADQNLMQRQAADAERLRQARVRQRDINTTYLPAEEEAERIRQYREAEQQELTQRAFENQDVLDTDLVNNKGNVFANQGAAKTSIAAKENSFAYEVVPVQGGFVGRLVEERLDPRHPLYGRALTEDEYGRIAASGPAYQKEQENLLRYQQMFGESLQPHEQTLSSDPIMNARRRAQGLINAQEITPRKIDESLVDSAAPISTFKDERQVVPEEIVEQPIEQRPVETAEDIQKVGVAEDLQARQDNIDAMQEELDANLIQQNQMDINDPRYSELQLDAEELRTNIQDARRELLVDRLVGRSDVRFQTAEEVADFRKANNLPEIKMRKDGSHPTQIASTKSTYRKVFNMMPDKIKSGRILDYGAGKNIGGKELGNEANVDSFEPYPEAGFIPTYSDTSNIPSNTYDGVFNNAVLNVVPDDIRNSIVKEIGRVLKPGGNAYINVRGKDVFDAKHHIIDKDNMEVIIAGNRSYQKGFKLDELVSYLKNTLGNNFNVVPAKGKNKFGAVSAIVTKKASESFEVREEQEPGTGIDLPTIQKQFKNQEVFKSDDGSINVKLKNGRGINIQSIQDAGDGYIQMAINTGQMSKAGKILGVTTGANILLDKDFADNNTLWHENKHVFDNLGMINKSDNSALVKEFNKLRKANKLGFSLSTHEDPMIALEENLANTFAQVMSSRESYRDTTLGKMIQRIMDFMQNLFSFSQQTVSGLAREIESGKFYERPGKKETLDKINPDIRFQTVEDLTKPKQTIPQKQYDEVYKQKKDLLGNIKQVMRKSGSEIKLLADKFTGAISTRLNNINPMLRDKMRELDYRTTQNIVRQLQVALPIMQNAKKNMSSQDKSDWDWARKNSDAGKIDQLATKYGFKEQYDLLREELNKIRNDAEEVGYNIGFLEDYWPRVLNDREGFLKETQDLTKDPIFSQALEAQAKKMGIKVEELDDNLRADIISNLILGRNLGISGTGNMQARKFAQIDPKYDKFYMNSDEALMQYIYSMNKKIEARRFFGKVPAKIQAIKIKNRDAKASLARMQELDRLSGTNSNAEAIAIMQDNIESYEQKLEAYKNQYDFSENIGSYVDELMAAGLVDKSKEQELRDILDARFHERGTTGVVNAYKNLAYIDTMGSPLSAITQIGDLAWAYYIGGLTPSGIGRTTKNLIKSIFKQSNITKEDLGFERISQEFADADSLSRAVNKTFKWVGLEKLDSIGKETLINTSLDNYKNKARQDPNKLKKEIRRLFGNKTDSVVNELLTDEVNTNPSDNVKYLVYSRVLDFHPAALSEMPEKYLNAGNGRVFYMLKSYTLKQMDVFRNEVWRNMKEAYKEKDPKKVIAGMQNMVSMGALLTLANAGADEIKDWLTGKETKFEDHVIENLMTLGGASRYMRMQTRQEGIGTTLAQKILPPFKFIDSISGDMFGDTSAGFRTVDSIPGVGRLYYWHFGRGADKRKSIAEQDFAKLKKDTTKFKKQLEKADDKRLFLQTNIDDFRRSKMVDNIQASLNKNKALIKRLKEMPETPNIRRRIGQLEQRRDAMLTRFMDTIE